MSQSSAPKLLTNCPMCNAPYGEQGIRPLGENGTMRLFHLTCSSCAHAVLAVILEHPTGVSSVGLVTDLEVSDALRFQDASPITADDCLNARTALEKRSREICAYFAQRTG